MKEVLGPFLDDPHVLPNVRGVCDVLGTAESIEEVLDEVRLHPRVQQWRVPRLFKSGAGVSNVAVRPVDKHGPSEEGGTLAGGDEPPYSVIN